MKEDVERNCKMREKNNDRKKKERKWKRERKKRNGNIYRNMFDSDVD